MRPTRFHRSHHSEGDEAARKAGLGGGGFVPLSDDRGVRRFSLFGVRRALARGRAREQGPRRVSGGRLGFELWIGFLSQGQGVGL